MSSLTPTAVLHGVIAIASGGGGTDNLPAVVFGTNTTPTIACPDAEHKTFNGLFGLTEVTLPDATEIASNGFAKLTSLQKVTAPEVITVGQNAFDSCTSLTDVSLPKCVTVGQEAFSYAFSNGAALSLPACTTISQRAFQNANLSSISCPSVTTVGYNAINASKITSMSLPLVTALPDGSLQGATSCATVNLPNCETIGESALSNDRALTDIDLPKVHSIGKSAFSGTSLTDVRLGYSGVVELPTLQSEYDRYSLFGFSENNITVHVPAGQLSAYQADSKWAKVVTETQNYGGSVTFVGDYA